MGGKCALPGTEHAVFKAVPARTRGACAAEAQARGAAAPAVSEAACVLLAERFAFLGNSLLRPMGSGTGCGLNEGFWEAFATGLGRAGFLGAARSALGRLAAHARREADAATADEAVLRIAQEHARLFVGPPKPAAPPWETMYAQPGRIGAVGFGRATFAMQDLLRAAGLRMAGESNQYADHLGIELLFAATLLGRGPAASTDAARFASERLAWTPAFASAVSEAAPDGYYRGVAELVCALSARLASAA